MGSGRGQWEEAAPLWPDSSGSVLSAPGHQVAYANGGWEGRGPTSGFSLALDSMMIFPRGRECRLLVLVLVSGAWLESVGPRTRRLLTLQQVLK